MQIDFDEIKDGEHFEDLTIAYFEEEKHTKGDIIDIGIRPSGTGTDGGRDILISFKVTDGIKSFDRIWIIQCKFWNRNISTNEISDINIPSLIHSYNADGYLLICRKKPTAKLTEHFEKLNDNCKFNYNYLIWSGEQFKRLLGKSPENILAQFFPKYYKQMLEMKKLLS
ncbi:restriction endonuclease [uncultured Kordia sp.]|uniref:restriction endonuclease n=1 Tax=uncultured Kordia sp. TaxID=507699 RepID=UPI002615A3BF|nr:restriction endonuclease [uncultured Kordia sp.]